MDSTNSPQVRISNLDAEVERTINFLMETIMDLNYKAAKKVVDAAKECFFYREHLDFLAAIRRALGHGAVPAVSDGVWDGFSGTGHKISVAEYETAQESAFNEANEPNYPEPLVVESFFDDEKKRFELTHQTSQLTIILQSSRNAGSNVWSPAMELIIAGVKITPRCIDGDICNHYCLQQGKEAAEALEQKELGEYQARAYQRVFLALFAHYWARGGNFGCEKGEEGYNAAMYQGLSSTFLDAVGHIYTPADDFIGYYPAVAFDEKADCGKKIRPVGRLYAVEPPADIPKEISWDKFTEILTGSREQYGWYTRSLN